MGRHLAGSCAFWRATARNVLLRTGSCESGCTGLNFQRMGITAFAPGIFDQPWDMNTALEWLTLGGNPLGCVPGVPDDVRLDIRRCPANCPANGAYYDAGAEACLACPDGTYAVGIGAAACDTPVPSTSITAIQIPLTTAAAAATPAPPAPACGGGARASVAHGASLCVPPELYPATNVSHCVVDKTWEDVMKLKGVLETGGLAELLVAGEYLGTGDPCRSHATASRPCLLRSLIESLSSSSSSE